MTNEQSSNNPLSRFFRDRRSQAPQPESAITPLTPEQRKEFAHTVYELVSNSPQDRTILQASQKALLAAGIPMHLDIEGAGQEINVSVKTSEKDRHEQAALSALFLGLSEATRLKLLEPKLETKTGSTEIVDPSKPAEEIATQLLQDLLSKPEMYKSFKDYYSGLRWSTDQGNFVKSLFIHSAEFDSELLDDNLRGSSLSGISDTLDMDISYDQYRNWYKSPAAEIVAQFPALDYHRLQDPEYRESEEGQKLLKAYARECGKIMADYHDQSRDISVTKNGEPLAKPLIPLTKHPIVEALIIDELRIDGPKPKYSMGPTDMIDVVLDSDSQSAHEALVSAICSRLPKDRRNTFDGPNEFQHKRRNIVTALREYGSSLHDQQRNQLLKQDLVKIMDAFTGQGSVAESVRTENTEYRAESNPWRKEVRDILEVGQLQDIVRDLIAVGLAAPDFEIYEKAENLVSEYIRLNKAGEKDPVGLEVQDLVTVTIDSLKQLTETSHPDVYERVATLIFEDPSIGLQMKEFAETQIESIRLNNTPEVKAAREALKEFRYSSFGNKDPREIEARAQLDEALVPAVQMSEKFRSDKNAFVLNLLRQLADSSVLNTNDRAAYHFKELVNRVDFNAYKAQELPSEYFELMQLGATEGLGDRQRQDIAWRVYSQFEYMDSESEALLVPVILDIYQMMLGPIDAVGLPSREEAFGLSAASSLTRKHGNGMFKSASQEQLQTLVKYADALKAQAERLATGGMIIDKSEMSSNDPKEAEEMLRNLESAVREINAIEEYYEKFLHREAVMVQPHVYYPWVLQEMVSFWQGLQWEVSPGNEPTRDIRKLYQSLEDLIRNKLVIKNKDQYDENFDVISEGNIDLLLKTCFEQMQIPHDIKYNNTVWQKGLPFLNTAISHMPKVLHDQLVEKYVGTQFAEFLQKEFERWQKDEQ